MGILDDLLIEIQAPVERPASVRRPGEVPRGGQPRAQAAPAAPSAPSILDDILAAPAPATPPQTPAQPQASGLDFSGSIADVRARIGALPADQRPKALAQWADTVVAKEREGGGLKQSAVDWARRTAKGVPVLGAWGEELVAGLNAALGDAPYDEALAYGEAKTRAARKATDTIKVVDKVPLIGGEITLGDLAEFGGGAAVMPWTPILRASKALPVLRHAPQSLLSRSVDTAVTGGLIGAAHGAGDGLTPEERAANARSGAAWGFGIGAAAPGVARGIGAAAGKLADTVAPMPAQVSAYTRGAVDRVSRAFDNDAPASTQRFGNEGMLADLGEELRQTTGALAATPGPQMTTINKAVLGRRLGASGRIAGDVDATLGPAQNLVELEAKTLKDSRAAAKPFYDNFYASELKPSEDLQRLLGQAKAVGAWEKAVKILEAEGIDPNTPVSNSRLIDALKRGVDDVVRDLPPGSNMHRITSGIAREITGEVDRILSPSDPSKSPWAQARRLAGDGLQFREGLEEGGKVFSKATHPDQMAADLRGQSVPYEAGYVSGGRGAIRDTMGNAGAAYGANGDIAALKMLNSEFAQQKFSQLVGPEGASRLRSRLATEAEFNRTYDDVLRNSKTAVRQSVQEGLPNPNAPYAPLPVSTVTTPGLLAEGVRWLADKATGSVRGERDAKVLKDMADMLVAQGAQRELIADGLRQYIVRNRVVGRARGQVDKLIGHLLRGAGVNAAVGDTPMLPSGR